MKSVLADSLVLRKQENYNYTTWGDRSFGVAQPQDQATAAPEERSISLELFKYTVLDAAGLTSVVMVGDQEVEAILETDLVSIAIMSRMPQSREVKTLMLSV